MASSDGRRLGIAPRRVESEVEINSFRFASVSSSPLSSQWKNKVLITCLNVNEIASKRNELKQQPERLSLIFVYVYIHDKPMPPTGITHAHSHGNRSGTNGRLVTVP